jgi:hypothetical protein
MAELKTKKQAGGVKEFLASIGDPKVRRDCETLNKLMAGATGAAGNMWGDAIVGFGERHLKYASGRELDWFVMGFSPRKANLTLYLGINLDYLKDLLNKLGAHTLGKGCLYIKRLSDVDAKTLEAIIKRAVKPDDNAREA